MTNKSSLTFVGAFVIVLSAGFIWGILWISAGGTPKNFKHYLVYMPDSVSGLNVDAPVKYRGVDVGKVEQISIDSKNPQRVRLLLQVREGTPIYSDTIASLEYQGLTGIANVNLGGGKAGAPPLKRQRGEDYPVIKGRPSIFSRLDSTLEELMTNLIETSKYLNALLGEDNRGNVSRTIESMATLGENLAQQSGHLEQMVKDLQSILEHTRAASEDFPQVVEQVSRSAEAITRMADEIRGVGEHLTAASANIEETVDAGSSAVDNFSRTTLPEVTTMVSELRAASENLRRMSETLADNPSVLIYGSPEPRRGPGE